MSSVLNAPYVGRFDFYYVFPMFLSSIMSWVKLEGLE